MSDHLRWWQQELVDEKKMDKFKRDCGSHENFFKKEIRRRIAEENYSSVLDCGAGLCTERDGFMEDGYEIRYIAIDVTDIFVEKGRERGIDIQKQSIEDIEFGDNFVDVCICLDTLNHQKCFKKSIEEMARVARKEVIISFFKEFTGRTVTKPRCFADEDKKDVNLLYTFFSKKEIEEFLGEKGYSFAWFRTKDRRDILNIKVNNEIG